MIFGRHHKREAQLRDALRDRLDRLPFTAAPAPWKLVGGAFISGLTDIGFVQETDDLLVVSDEGRFLFDALTGKRLAHDPVRFFQDDPFIPHRSATAIGKHAKVRVELAGLHGGGLSRFTDDGWAIDVIQLPWPSHFLFLSSDYLPLSLASGHVWKVCEDHPHTFRSSGFSPTGRSFAFATSGEVLIYSRYNG